MKCLFCFLCVAVMVAGVGIADAASGDKDCGVGTTSINLQQVQVGAISSNLNAVQTNGGLGGFGLSIGTQESIAIGTIIPATPVAADPIVRVDTYTHGGTIAFSKGNAAAGGENHGTAYGSGVLLDLYRYRSFGR